MKNIEKDLAMIVLALVLTFNSGCRKKIFTLKKYSSQKIPDANSNEGNNFVSVGSSQGRADRHRIERFLIPLQTCKNNVLINEKFYHSKANKKLSSNKINSVRELWEFIEIHSSTIVSILLILAGVFWIVLGNYLLIIGLLGVFFLLGIMFALEILIAIANG